jgi:hypothetical protein
MLPFCQLDMNSNPGALRSFSSTLGSRMANITHYIIYIFNLPGLFSTYIVFKYVLVWSDCKRPAFAELPLLAAAGTTCPVSQSVLLIYLISYFLSPLSVKGLLLR